MERTDGTYRPGVSIHEAAVMLGVSPTTVRRWVASGKLRSQRFSRPQGEVVRVFVSPDQLDAAPAVREQVSAAQVPTHAPPRAEEQMPNGQDALAVWSATVLAPLVATIVEQAETIGQLRAELVAARAPQQRQAPSGASESPDPPTEPPPSWWRLWWPLMATVPVAIVLAVVLLTIPR